MAAIFAPKVQLSSGAIEALKYVALASMVIDHVNKAFFAGSLDFLVPAGRLAMPIFAILVGYNLARPVADYRKMLFRFIAVGALAQPFHLAITEGAWLPLNVLFTFALATTIIALLDLRREAWALGLFVVGSFFVDYQWSGVALVIAATWYVRNPTPITLAGILASITGICWLVGNPWSLLALPAIIAAQIYSPYVPRIRWLFWFFYPAHLALLLLLQ